jgi:hypothetical protein
MSDQPLPSIDNSSLLDSFEQAAKFASLIGGALLLLSVFYDFSFLTALHLHFSEVPTTISDHIRSAIVWVPQVGGMVLLFFLYELLMRRVEGSLPLRRIQNSQKIFVLVLTRCFLSSA